MSDEAHYDIGSLIQGSARRKIVEALGSQTLATIEQSAMAEVYSSELQSALARLQEAGSAVKELQTDVENLKVQVAEQHKARSAANVLDDVAETLAASSLEPYVERALKDSRDPKGTAAACEQLADKPDANWRAV